MVSALALVGAPACAPEPVGSRGQAISGLYETFFVIAAVVFVVVAGLIGWSIVRYRARPGDDSLPRQTAHNLPLEIAWFAIPQIVVVVLFVLSAGALQEVNEASADPAVTINVEGFQWGWRFTYEGEAVAVEGIPQDPADIVVPTGVPLRFELHSEDVDHSFYVPRWLIKRDLIPGRVNRIHYTIEEEGTYRGACAEFCGLLHHRMLFTIRAVSPQAYEQWLTDRRQEREDAGI